MGRRLSVGTSLHPPRPERQPPDRPGGVRWWRRCRARR